MNSEHVSKSQLLEVLYGLEPETEHLKTCAVCRRRLDRMTDVRRSFVAAESEVAESFLAAQRRSIRSRLPEGSPRGWRRLAPIPVALILAAAFLVDFERRPTPSVPVVEDDSRVFEEVFDIVSDPAPQAVEPIRTFFEDRQ